MLVWIRPFRWLQENTFDKKVKWTLTRKRKLKKNKELTPQKHYCMKKNPTPALPMGQKRWRGSSEKVLQLSRKSGEIRAVSQRNPSHEVSALGWAGSSAAWKTICGKAIPCISSEALLYPPVANASNFGGNRGLQLLCIEMQCSMASVLSW